MNTLGCTDSPKSSQEDPQGDLLSTRTMGSSPSPEKGTEELTGGLRKVFDRWLDFTLDGKEPDWKELKKDIPAWERHYWASKKEP